MDATLALVHAVDPTLGPAGTAFIHSALDLDRLQAVNVMMVGKVQLPLPFLTADGTASPYLQLFCLMSEGTGAAVMKSRRNLPRAGQITL